MAATTVTNKKTTTKSTPKQSPVAKSKSSKSKYQEMLIESISKQIGTGRNATVSIQSITKYIFGNFELNQTEKTVKNHIKTALKKCVEEGSLIQHTGTGCNGSFKFPSKAQIAAKAAEKKANDDEGKETTAVKKPKTPIKKKSTASTKSPAPKKVTAKKTPTKSAAPKMAPKKSPKKAKKETAPVKKTK